MFRKIRKLLQKATFTENKNFVIINSCSHNVRTTIVNNYISYKLFFKKEEFTHAV